MTEASRDFDKVLYLLFQEWLEPPNFNIRCTFWRGIDKTLLLRQRLFFTPFMLKTFRRKGDRKYKTSSLKSPDMPQWVEIIPLIQRVVEINRTRNDTLNPGFDTGNYRLSKYSSITLFHENYTENKIFSRKDCVWQ